MANPNIVGVTSIYGKSTGLAVTTSTQVIVSNSSASGKIYKINSLTVANINGSSSADVSVEVYKNQSVVYKLAHTVTVPNDATLVVISKDTSIYLEENDSIRITGSANSYLDAFCSWEEIN